MEKQKIESNGNPKSQRVAIYVRVSTQEQATEWCGLDSQKRILENFVKANEDKYWVTSDELFYSDEGISGTTEVAERQALSRLRDDVFAKKVDVVLVWKIDRLFRKTSLLLEFVEFLKKSKVNFVSKNENVDLDSHTGKLVLTLLWAIAEMERDVIAERTLEGKKTKSMQGYVVYGKFVPFGYEKISDGKGSLLAVHPEESEIVREIFRMYGYENKSSGEIARILTERWVGTNIDRKNSEGKTLRTKMHTGLFRQHSIMRILQNKAYIGIYISNKTKTIKNERGKIAQIPKDESEWIISECDRIVDDEIFYRVQELIKQGRVVHGHGEKGVHIFTGLAKCAECGRGYHYYQSKKKTGNYSCWGKKKSKVSEGNRCSNPDISENKLMEIVWPQVELFLRNPGDLVRRYGSSLASWEWRDREEKCRKELAEVEKAVLTKKQELKMARLKEIQHPDEAEIFSEIASELWAQLHALEKQKETLSTDLEAYDRYEEQVKVIAEHSKAIQKRIGSVTDEERAGLMRELLEGIYIGKEEIAVKYKFEKG